MTLNDRDRRILIILIPIVVLLAYWFLILSPKRADLKTAQDRQSTAEQERDAAVALAAQLEKARASFATDYAAVVRLGKAIPATIDSPSLLVQLDRAANGTHIDLSTVTFGERAPATVVTTTAAPTGATGTSGPQPGGNAAAGGAPAQTQPGQQAEAAGNAANQAGQANAAATDTTVSTTAGAATPAAPAPSALDQVAVTFNFTGSYFDLADFFHRLKRFVYVANNQIFVRGRLIQIESVSFAPGSAGATGASTSDITTAVTASVYLSPKAEGATAGATAAGPSGTTTTTPPPGQTAGAILPTATVGAR